MPPRASPGGIFYVLTDYRRDVVREMRMPGKVLAATGRCGGEGLAMRQKARQPLLQDLIFAAQARVLVQQR